MRSRLEIVSKLVEDKHITFEEGLMLMEEVIKQQVKQEPLKTTIDLTDWISNPPQYGCKIGEGCAVNDPKRNPYLATIDKLSIIKMNEGFCAK